VKYSSHATIEGEPRFELRAQAEPIAITCGLEGRVRAGIGPIEARIGPVPVTVTIPFLGGSRRVAVVGPFEVRLDPVDVAIEEIELRCAGALGAEGLTVGLEGRLLDKMEIDVVGKLPGRVARARLEFEEEEGEHEEDDER
jgi:hypothetical protein